MDAKVVARYIILILTLVSQFLTSKGASPIPTDEEGVPPIILTVAVLYTTYKGNPTSQEGKWTNQKLKRYEAESKYRKATGQAPTKEVMTPTNIDDTNGLGQVPTDVDNKKPGRKMVR